MMNNPILVTRPYMPEKEVFMQYADKLWNTRWLTNGGPLVQELQQKLCERLRVPNLVVFANGHLALDCAVKALNLGDGEAITTPFTYISTANALAMNGLRPVFCDIKPGDCTIDEEKIEALITEKTKAIVPVHVYGFPCNHRAIQRIADRHGLKVIYDAAHAFSVEVDGVGIGNLGDASMFSFHATKVYHTVEGGGVACKDPSLTDRLIAAKNFGLVTKEEADTVGLNAKMSELHAAMGLVNLRIIDMQIEKRRELVEHYLKRFAGASRIELFRWDAPGVRYNYAYFPILVSPDSPVGRDELVARLMDQYQIQSRKYFYPLMSDFNCHKELAAQSHTPVAKDIADRICTLPLYMDLTHDQVDYVCDAVLTILGSAAG